MNQELAQLAMDALAVWDFDTAFQAFNLADVIPPICPDCKQPLDLYANGDNGPQDDRWSCATCGIEYPHHRFPLPRGYVKHAKAIEAQRAADDQRNEELATLAAWNKAMS